MNQVELHADLNVYARTNYLGTSNSFEIQDTCHAYKDFAVCFVLNTFFSKYY